MYIFSILFFLVFSVHCSSLIHKEESLLEKCAAMSIADCNDFDWLHNALIQKESLKQVTKELLMKAVNAIPVEKEKMAVTEYLTTTTTWEFPFKDFLALMAATDKEKIALARNISFCLEYVGRKVRKTDKKFDRYQLFSDTLRAKLTKEIGEGTGNPSLNNKVLQYIFFQMAQKIVQERGGELRNDPDLSFLSEEVTREIQWYIDREISKNIAGAENEYTKKGDVTLSNIPSKEKEIPSQTIMISDVSSNTKNNTHTTPSSTISASDTHSSDTHSNNTPPNNIPSSAIPTNSIPANTIPTNTINSNDTSSSDAHPSEIHPNGTSQSNALSSETLPGGTLQGTVAQEEALKLSGEGEEKETDEEETIESSEESIVYDKYNAYDWVKDIVEKGKYTKEIIEKKLHDALPEEKEKQKSDTNEAAKESASLSQIEEFFSFITQKEQRIFARSIALIASFIAAEEKKERNEEFMFSLLSTLPEKISKIQENKEALLVNDPLENAISKGMAYTIAEMLIARQNKKKKQERQLFPRPYLSLLPKRWKSVIKKYYESLLPPLLRGTTTTEVASERAEEKSGEQPKEKFSANGEPLTTIVTVEERRKKEMKAKEQEQEEHSKEEKRIAACREKKIEEITTTTFERKKHPYNQSIETIFSLASLLEEGITIVADTIAEGKGEKNIKKQKLKQNLVALENKENAITTLLINTGASLQAGMTPLSTQGVEGVLVKKEAMIKNTFDHYLQLLQESLSDLFSTTMYSYDTVKKIL